MKSLRTTPLIRAALAIIVGLLLVVHGSFAVAAKPSVRDAQSSRSKIHKARTKPSANKNHPRRPSTNLDGSEALDTLELALENAGENLYEESDGSGTCQTGTPGSNGFGKLQQGWIEKSNVDLRQELVEWKHIRQTCRTIRSLLDGL